MKWTRNFTVMMVLVMAVVGGLVSIIPAANAETTAETSAAVYRDYVRSSIQITTNTTVGTQTSVNISCQLNLRATSKTMEHYRATWTPMLILAYPSQDPLYEIGQIYQIITLKSKTGYDLAKNSGRVPKTITGLPSGQKFLAYVQWSNNLGYSEMSNITEFTTKYPELDEIRVGSVQTKVNPDGSVCLTAKLSSLYGRPGCVQAFFEIVSEYDCSRNYAFLDNGNIDQARLAILKGEIKANFKPWVQGKFSIKVHIYDFANETIGVDVTNLHWTIFDPGQTQLWAQGTATATCQ